MVYNFEIKNINTNVVQMTRISLDQQPMSWQQVLDGWKNSREFREVFFSFLRNAPYDAYRWETPPLTKDRLQQPFECILLDSPYLQTRVDIVSFQQHFQQAKSGESVLNFMNLGRDARLIVPTPVEPLQACAHLASFVREVPQVNNHDLWKMVGEVVPQELGDQPRWLSTAGGGVAWLHVRIDHRPKYYGYTPYRQFP